MKYVYMYSTSATDKALLTDVLGVHLVVFMLLLFDRSIDRSGRRELALQSHEVVVAIGGVKGVCIFGGVPKPQQKVSPRPPFFPSLLPFSLLFLL